VSHLIGPMEQPVLILWGKRDKALGHEMAEPPRDLVSDYRIEKYDAGHFLQADEPDTVRDRVLGFLEPRDTVAEGAETAGPAT